MSDFPSRLLITGASGFVGRKLVDHLRSNFVGADLICLDGPGSKDGIDLKSADLDQILQASRPAAVIHLAAKASVGLAAKDVAAAIATNLTASLRLAEAFAKIAPGAPFIFAGTGEAYGASFRDAQGAVETTPLAPLTVYSRTKAAAEWGLKDLLAGACPFIPLRLFNHTGPGQSEDYVVPSFAAQLARIEKGCVEPRLKVGNLEAARDFLDVDDVIDAYVAALRFGMSGGEGVFNVCSGRPRTIRSILDGLLALSTIKPVVEVDQDRLRPSEIPVAFGDATAFQRATGWCPTRPFDLLIDRIMEDWRKRVIA